MLMLAAAVGRELPYWLDHGDGGGGWGWAGDQDGDGSLAGQQLRVLVSVAADPSVWARCQIFCRYCIQRSRFDST
jgi:hypothetical protein